MNVSMTQYDVVRKVGRKAFNWKLSYDAESEEWDMFWTDSAVQPERLARMKPYQKINHFPGMYELSMKNHLARNLNKLRKLFPDAYDFFPRTWLIPAELGDFRAQIGKKPAKTFILKPEASCQGRGIFLTKDLNDIDMGGRYVAQEYIKRPYLIEDLKFDLRIYVLVAGCDPLRIFVHEDGLGRFATQEYVLPRKSNMSDMCMHLTNYAINKDNPNFVYNEDSEQDDIGHKRSLIAVYESLEADGVDVVSLKKEIAAMIIKTLCSAQPILAHTYKSCQPEDVTNGMCFEVLGFDVLLDENCKPWLLEVNHTPSFTTDTPLDKKIKYKVISDSLEIMNIALRHRKNYLIRQRAQLQQRAMTGKLTKETKERRDELVMTARMRRDRFEAKHLNGFTKVYPVEDSETYNCYIASAKDIWEEWTGAKISRLKKEEPRSPFKRPEVQKPKAVSAVKPKLETERTAPSKLSLQISSASAADSTRDSVTIPVAPIIDNERSQSKPLLSREKLDLAPFAYQVQEEVRLATGQDLDSLAFTPNPKIQDRTGVSLVQRMSEVSKKEKCTDEVRREYKATSIRRLPSDSKVYFPLISSTHGNYVKQTLLQFDLKSGLSQGTRHRKRL
jgi:tubulin polyglutamylase TTLL6/13